MIVYFNVTIPDIDNAQLNKWNTPLIKFTYGKVNALGEVALPLFLGSTFKRFIMVAKNFIVETPLSYNITLGIPISTYFKR